MDEAAKRRERLKAMRKEAEQAEQAGQAEQLNSPALFPPASLSNPFADTLATSTAVKDPSHAPRFDYYTDPLSAFSANKRRNVMDQAAGKMNLSSSRPGQMQMQYSPGERPCGGNLPSAGMLDSWRNPMPISFPPPSGTSIPGHAAWNPYGNQQGYGFDSSPHPNYLNQVHPSQEQRPVNGNLYSAGTLNAGRSLLGSPFPMSNIPFAGQNAWNPSGNQWGFPLGLRSPNLVCQQGNVPNFHHGIGGPRPADGRSSYSPDYGRGSNYGQVHGRGSVARPLDVGKRSMGDYHDGSHHLGFECTGVKPGDNTPTQSVDFDSREEHESHTDIPGQNLDLDSREKQKFHDHTLGPNFGLDKMGEHAKHDNKPRGGSGSDKGKGRTSCSKASVEEKAKLYYMDTMVVDPWRHMKPVVRSPTQYAADCADLEKAWLPKSVRLKGAKVEEAMKFQNHTSIADCLADSLKEATGDL